MRCQRMVTSISVCSSMCPMCSTPVTLGGGMTSEKTRPGASAEAPKIPESIHHCAQCGSNRWGSYTFSICMENLSLAGGLQVVCSVTPAIFFSRRLRLLIGEEPGGLVSGGLYRFSRNPMYFGVLMVVF